MNPNEFSSQLDRLRENFGDKAISREKANLLWERVRNHELINFKQAVDYLISELQKTPRVSDVVDALYSIPRKNEIAKCSFCNGDGWILGAVDTPQANVAMRCRCLGGPERLANNIKSHPRNPDSSLASDILNTFSGMSQEHWKLYGKRETQAHR